MGKPAIVLNKSNIVVAVKQTADSREIPYLLIENGEILKEDWEQLRDFLNKILDENA